jgi:hypothetical protein
MSFHRLLPAALFSLAIANPLSFAASQRADFNADGFDDLAVGIPFKAVNGVLGAGAIHVLYGSPNGVTAANNLVWSQAQLETVEENDQFGFALASGDFNGDGFDDLAIGVPEEDVGTIVNAGSVQVLFGSAAGLTGIGNQNLNQNTPGIRDSAESGDAFGRHLSVADFDSDGFADLAIGVPFEDLDAIADAGAVNVLYGSPSGLDAGDDDFWNQGSTGISNAPDSTDWFGFALTAGDFDGDGHDDLAIGVPFEEIGGIPNAGAVQVIYGSPSGLRAAGSQFWHQNSNGVPDSAEADDAFGSSLTAADFDGNGRDDLAIGAAVEDIGAVTDAGAVTVMYGTPSGLSATGSQYWHQNISGVKDNAEPDDNFGRLLAAGDLDGDGRDDLAIDSINESIGSIYRAGGVHVLYGSSSGLAAAGNQFWHQNSPGVRGSAEGAAYFGTPIAIHDFDGNGRFDLAIGISLKDVGSNENAGAVAILYGSASGVTATDDQIWHQNSPDVDDAAAPNDKFGAAIAIAPARSETFTVCRRAIKSQQPLNDL